MKQEKPKKLNLSEIWQLYLVLKNPINSGEKKKLLIDEIERILDNSPPGTLISSLEIMYNSVEKDISPTEALVLFIQGLKNNNFFAFVEFVEKLNGRSS